MNSSNPSPQSLPAQVSIPYKYQLTLLIDDNYIDNFINKLLLEASNISQKNYVATNGQLALNLIEQLSSESVEPLFPDLMLVDLNMPVMDGLEFIREFRKLHHAELKNCKIVVLTSSIHDNDRKNIYSLDPTIVFSNKPLSLVFLNSL